MSLMSFCRHARPLRRHISGLAPEGSKPVRVVGIDYQFADPAGHALTI